MKYDGRNPCLENNNGKVQGRAEVVALFGDSEKASGGARGEELWCCIRKSGVTEKYMKVVKDMYKDSIIEV